MARPPSINALALWQIGTGGALTLANSFTYSTWGTPTTTVAAGFTDLGFRFLYVGAHGVAWDNALGLGLLYMSARHYSPSLGRFLQPDPSAAETNPYAYVENNPVTRIDPEGTFGPLAIPIVIAVACLENLPICFLVVGTVYATSVNLLRLVVPKNIRISFGRGGQPWRIQRPRGAVPIRAGSCAMRVTGCAKPIWPPVLVERHPVSDLGYRTTPAPPKTPSQNACNRLFNTIGIRKLKVSWKTCLAATLVTGGGYLYFQHENGGP